MHTTATLVQDGSKLTLGIAKITDWKDMFKITAGNDGSVIRRCGKLTPIQCLTLPRSRELICADWNVTSIQYRPTASGPTTAQHIWPSSAKRVD